MANFDTSTAPLAPLGQTLSSSQDTITAHAGGTQALGVPLVAQINRISVCATSGDSVVLPKSTAGMDITVANAGAASCNVFPFLGDTINALSVNAAFAVAAGKTASFFCATALQWHTILSA